MTSLVVEVGGRGDVIGGVGETGTGGGVCSGIVDIGVLGDNGVDVGMLAIG